MTAAASEPIKALDQVRDFFEELASLLLTADSLMAKANWSSVTGNAALTGLSYSLGSPRQWMPQSLYRRYGHPSVGTLVPTICAILGVDEPDEKLLSQPLVTASLYHYDVDLKEVDDKYPDLATWHLWMPTRRDDGRVCRFDPRTDDDWARYCRAVAIESFAVPLLDITDATSLDAKLVSPLLALIDRAVPLSSTRRSS